VIVHHLQYRHDRVGGATGSRQNLVVIRDGVAIDAVHNVLQRAFAGRREQHARDTGAFQVEREAGFVSPRTGVVDHNSVLDAVGRVVDLVRAFGVNHFDEVAVGDQRAVFGVDGDGPVERTMYR